MGDWTFFSNYGHVLVCLARNRDARLRDVAREVGITERAVQKIVRDLQDAAFLEVTKQGRCNRYRVNRRKSLRHPLESHCTVGQLLALIARGAASEEAAEPAAPVMEPVSAPAERPAPAPSAPGAAPPPEAPGEGPPQADREEKPAKAAAKEKESSRKQPPQDSRDQGSLF